MMAMRLISSEIAWKNSSTNPTTTRSFAGQTANPPAFTFFVNHTDLVNDTYRRYIENRMRQAFDFEGTPIRLYFRKKDSGNDREK